MFFAVLLLFKKMYKYFIKRIFTPKRFVTIILKYHLISMCKEVQNVKLKKNFSLTVIMSQVIHFDILRYIQYNLCDCHIFVYNKTEAGCNIKGNVHFANNSWLLIKKR